MPRLTVNEAASKLNISEAALRKRMQRNTIAHGKWPDGRVYVYIPDIGDDKEDAQEEKKPETTNQEPPPSWWERVSAAAGLVAILSTLIYVLGLFNLWVPIWRAYTHDLVSAWHAVSLVPRTVVAGLGVAQLVGFPLLVTVLLFAAMLPVERLFGHNQSIYVAWGAIALYAGWRITTVLASYSPHLSVWRVALVAYLAMASIVVCIFGVGLAFLLFSLELRESSSSSLIGYLTSLLPLMGALPWLVALYFAWPWAMGKEPLMEHLKAIGGPALLQTFVVLAAAFIALAGASIASFFLARGRSNWLVAAAAIGAAALTAAFLLTTANNPPLPAVTVQISQAGEHTDKLRTIHGHLLAHTEGIWYVFDQEGTLIAIPDDKLEAARWKPHQSP